MGLDDKSFYVTIILMVTIMAFHAIILEFSNMMSNNIRLLLMLVPDVIFVMGLMLYYFKKAEKHNE